MIQLTGCFQLFTEDLRQQKKSFLISQKY